MRRYALLPWLFCAPLGFAQTQFSEGLIQHLPPDLEETHSLARGDLDGDGDLDLVCGNTDQNRLYMNDGQGRFLDFTAVGLPPDQSLSDEVALGDVDGDGDLDIFCANGGTPRVRANQDRLYLNDGRGRFRDATATKLPIDDLEDARALALGDLDGDGDLDAFIGTGIGVLGQRLPNKVLLNNGNGAFWVASGALPVEFETCLSAALGDVDGDGDLDLATGNEIYSPTRLYLNDGRGRFTRTAAIPTNGGGARGVAWIDVDRDGDLDLVCACAGAVAGNQNLLFLNDGRGGFRDATATHLPVALDSSTSVAHADLDRDGDLDLVFGNQGGDPPSLVPGDRNRVVLNDGSGRFLDSPGWTPAVRDETSALALIDVDGDGDDDLVSGNHLHCHHVECGGRNNLFLNIGAGFALATVASRLPGDRLRAHDLELADLDGDGDLDLAVAAEPFHNPNPAERNRLYLNDGRGNFADLTLMRMPADTEATMALAAGDVDRDGDIDLFFANRLSTPMSGQNVLYLNDGSGAFGDVSATHLPVQSQGTIDAVFGDVDGDADLDVVLGNSDNWPRTANQLWLNDGTGRFRDAPAQMPRAIDNTAAVALADLDGDGDLDLLVGNFRGPNKVYLNDGRGSFAQRVGGLPGDSTATTAVAVGDVDGDGNLDIAFANDHATVAGGSHNRLYLGDGTGLFSDVAARLPQRAAGAGSRSVHLVDLDEDGDLDLLFGNDGYPTGGQDNAYINDSSGHFSDATRRCLPARVEPTKALATGDVDGDGDLDLFAGSWHDQMQFPLRGYANHLRQVTARVLPRIGAACEWEIHARAGFAPPAQLAFPVLALRALAAPLPLPPLGSWHLDPALSIPLPTVALAAGTGAASATLAIPPLGALVGLDLHIQAVILPTPAPPTWRFTNAERTRIYP